MVGQALRLAVEVPAEAASEPGQGAAGDLEHATLVPGEKRFTADTGQQDTRAVGVAAAVFGSQLGAAGRGDDHLIDDQRPSRRTNRCRTMACLCIFAAITALAIGRYVSGVSAARSWSRSRSTLVTAPGSNWPR